MSQFSISGARIEHEAREAYYHDQYSFTAPTSRGFYDAGTVGTCIGFEVARVLENHAALPVWDAMRVTGAMQFLKIAWVLGIQLQVFNAAARKMGHSSALDVVHSRDAQREKDQIHAVQARPTRCSS